jgi:hypothetical protein
MIIFFLKKVVVVQGVSLIKNVIVSIGMFKNTVQDGFFQKQFWIFKVYHINGQKRERR